MRHNVNDLLVPVAPVAVDVLSAIVSTTDPVLLLCTDKTRSTALEALRTTADKRKNKCIVVDADLGESDLKSIVTSAQNDASFECRSFDTLLAAGRDGRYSVPSKANEENGTRLCVFSSGSTGRPKGIVSSSAATLFPLTRMHLSEPWVNLFW